MPAWDQADTALGPAAVRYGVVAYRVLYRSVSAAGRPIRASGLAAFATGRTGNLQLVDHGDGTTSHQIPISEGERAMADPVIHFEIIGKDATALQQFYTDLFGWDIDAGNPLKYGMVAAGDGGIGGGVGPTIDGTARTMFYVGVEDLHAKIEEAQALGATTVMPPMDVPGGPSIAMFTDPDGNLIGLMKRP
ncbi:MAG TPA: VOC family protein [Trebonia sp.]